MPFLQPSSFQVPSIVTDDMLVIDALDDKLADSVIHYIIADEKDHVCRQGSFRGLRIQMRIAHLKDGIYQLLLKDAEAGCSFWIQKISGRFLLSAAPGF